MQIDSSQNYPHSSIYIYTDPVKRALESYVTVDCGQSISQLEPVINCAIDEVIRTSPDLNETLSDRILRQRIELKAKTYIKAVLSQTKLWRSCREHIKAFYSVFLVGAGLSYESDMPLSNLLKTILEFCKVSEWHELRKNPEIFLEFKQQFKIICDRKLPSNSHKLIIANFPKYIYEIICLNWDDLLEKAAIAIGVSINKINEDIPTTDKRYLWKYFEDG